MKPRKKKDTNRKNTPKTRQSTPKPPIIRYTQTKIGFLNINGINDHSLIEAENTIKTQDLNIAILAETKIRLENDFEELEINGYKHFQIRRSDAQQDKQGGGLIVYFKTGITTKYEIPINNIEDNELKYVQSERGWIISKNFKTTTATCFVYAAYQNTDNSNIYWNEGIYKVISKEQEKYKNMGYRVIIIGDLNGHIGNK